MHTDVFDEWVRGKTCESCAIYKPDVFGFMLGWSLQEDIDKSKAAGYFLIHHLDDGDSGESKDHGVTFRGDRRRRIAVDPNTPELIVAAAGGNVRVQNEQGGRNEKMLSRDEIIGAQAVRYIGRHFYIAGGVRRVLRRDGPEQWTDITQELRDDSLRPVDTLYMGFDDIDGFDESDMYAVGGDGDVWHFDGQKWFQIDVPTNDEIKSVCCASDGNVYIGGVGHMILRGRQDQWEIVNQEDTNEIFLQIVDYNSRVLAVDEWGSTIYEITADGVKPMNTGDFIFPATSCLCMSVGYGMLLTAGLESASVFDGKTWRSVFRSYEEEDVAQVQTMLNQANTTLDDLLKSLQD